VRPKLKQRKAKGQEYDAELEGQSVSGSGYGKKLSKREPKIMKPKGPLKPAHADPWDN
jgi:hypothetical protein